MKRVAIVGSPGVGKTVFSQKLAKKLKLPLIHLDFYYHQKEYDYYNNKDDWIKKIAELIKSEEWIMDGNYSSSSEARFKRADTIIFLDFPRRKALTGVAKRRYQYRKQRRKDMPSDWKEKADIWFIKYVWKFNNESRHKIITAIENNKNKNILIFKNRRQVDEFLASL